MNGMNFKSMTIGKKLLFFGILGSAIPVLIIGGIAVWEGSKNVETVSRECNRLATDDLDHIVLGLCGTLKSHQEELQRKIACDLNVAANELAAMGGVAFDGNKVAGKRGTK